MFKIKLFILCLFVCIPLFAQRQPGKGRQPVLPKPFMPINGLTGPARLTAAPSVQLTSDLKMQITVSFIPQTGIEQSTELVDGKFPLRIWRDRFNSTPGVVDLSVVETLLVPIDTVQNFSVNMGNFQSGDAILFEERTYFHTTLTILQDNKPWMLLDNNGNPYDASTMVLGPAKIDTPKNLPCTCVLWNGPSC